MSARQSSPFQLKPGKGPLHYCFGQLPVLKYASMATLDKDDLNAIKGLIEASIDERMVTKDDISHLPTKDEFYGKMDEVMGELKAMREEVSVLSHQVADHDDRIEKIENHIGFSSN